LSPRRRGRGGAARRAQRRSRAVRRPMAGPAARTRVRARVQQSGHPGQTAHRPTWRQRRAAGGGSLLRAPPTPRLPLHTPLRAPTPSDEPGFEEFAAAFNKASQLAAADGQDGANCLGWAARDTSAKLAPYKFKRRELGPTDVFVKITHAGAGAGSLAGSLPRAAGEWVCSSRRRPGAWTPPGLSRQPGVRERRLASRCHARVPPSPRPNRVQACVTATCTPSTATGGPPGEPALLASAPQHHSTTAAPGLPQRLHSSAAGWAPGPRRRRLPHLGPPPCCCRAASPRAPTPPAISPTQLPGRAWVSGLAWVTCPHPAPQAASV
jgi:hypothetical protein